MKLVKRGKIYHAQMKSAEGKMVSITTKETDKDRALASIKESGLDKVEAAAKTHRLTGEGVARILAGKRVTVGKAIEAWENGMRDVGAAPRTVQNSMEVIRRWAGAMDINSISPMSVTADHVGKWINDPSSPAKLTTRRIAISIIGQFLQFCTHRGWNMGNQAKLTRVNMNILSHEQKESKERQSFTTMEVMRLLAYLAVNNDNPFWQLAVRLSYETGLRLGDICQLEWTCFDRDGEIVVWTDKRNKRVAVPISLEVSSLISSLPVEDARYLFPVERKLVLDPSRRAALSVQFVRMCERTGITGKTFHCLRHTFVQRHRELGDSWDSIASALGHSCDETTKGYATKEVGGSK